MRPSRGTHSPNPWPCKTVLAPWQEPCFPNRHLSLLLLGREYVFWFDLRSFECHYSLCPAYERKMPANSPLLLPNTWKHAIVAVARSPAESRIHGSLLDLGGCAIILLSPAPDYRTITNSLTVICSVTPTSLFIPGNRIDSFDKCKEDISLLVIECLVRSSLWLQTPMARSILDS